MTTKQQERDALAKIRKIVDDLGENSYIGTAFEGCFEEAEFNIDSDAAFSLKGRLELAQQELETAKDDLCAAKGAFNAEHAAHKETKHQLAGAEAREQALSEELSHAKNRLSEYMQEAQDGQDYQDRLEQTIIQLKAKLYDHLMIAQA